jgi:hypothetical protein
MQSTGCLLINSHFRVYCPIHVRQGLCFVADEQDAEGESNCAPDLKKPSKRARHSAPAPVVDPPTSITAVVPPRRRAPLRTISLAAPGNKDRRHDAVPSLKTFSMFASSWQQASVASERLSTFSPERFSVPPPVLTSPRLSKADTAESNIADVVSDTNKPEPTSPPASVPAVSRMSLIEPHIVPTFRHDSYNLPGVREFVICSRLRHNLTAPCATLWQVMKTPMSFAPPRLQEIMSMAQFTRAAALDAMPMTEYPPLQLKTCATPSPATSSACTAPFSSLPIDLIATTDGLISDREAAFCKELAPAAAVHIDTCTKSRATAITPVLQEWKSFVLQADSSDMNGLQLPFFKV